MKKNRSPFDILGVSPADDMTVIRMAWRRKVRQLHPDLAEDKASATAELAEVNAAFDAVQGHVPKRTAKKPSPRKKSSEARVQETASKPEKPVEQPKKTSAQTQSPQQARTEKLRRTAKARLSAEMRAKGNRARAGYAQARGIVAVA